MSCWNNERIKLLLYYYYIIFIKIITIRLLYLFLDDDSVTRNDETALTSARSNAREKSARKIKVIKFHKDLIINNSEGQAGKLSFILKLTAVDELTSKCNLNV